MSALVGGAYFAALQAALELVVPRERFDLREPLTPEQLEWWNLIAPEKALLCGRRAGKTTLLASWLVDGAIAGGENEWCAYIALTRKSAEEAVWVYVKQAARRSGVPHVIDEGMLMITFEGGASVILGGLETVRDLERYRGKKYRRVVFDECGALRQTLLRRCWEEVIEPACMDVGGEAAFSGTPGIVPDGFWYELTRDGAELETGIPVRRWTALVNPHVRDPAAYFERIKAKHGWTDDTPTFVREYLGRWVTDFGARVFPLEPGRNLVVALPTVNGFGLELARDRWRYVISLDFGVEEPTAVAVLAAHRDLAHRRFVLSTEKRSHWLTRDLAAYLADLRGSYPNAPVVGDTGGMGAWPAQELTREHGIPIECADKTHRLGQIYLVRDGLISGTIQAVVGPGKPEEGPTAALVDEWSKLVWDPDKPGEPAAGEDHAGDAVRYGLGRLHHYLRDEPVPVPIKTVAEAMAEEIEKLRGKTMREADERHQRAAREKLRQARAVARAANPRTRKKR